VWPYGTFTINPWAVSAQALPLKSAGVDDGQAIDYTDVNVAVNYGIQFQSNDGQFYSEQLEPTVEFIPLDYKTFTWQAIDEDGDLTDAPGKALKESEAPGRQLRSMSLVRTFYRVEEPLNSVLLSASGYINSESYTSGTLGLTFPAGTLLYIPPTIDRSIQADGSMTMTVTCRFNYKEVGWNWYWRADKQIYSQMWSINGAAIYNSYPETDFSALLF
jgi:hypothetical protein